MSQRDFYEILGIAKNTDVKQIKKAYKRLAMKHHPDRVKDNKELAEKKFKEIQKAYAILSDTQKRQAYDQFGHAGINGNAGATSGTSFSSSGFGDIFGDIFGGGSQQSNNRGSDLRYDLEIDLKEAAQGTTVKIRIPKNETCDTCSGTGAKPGTSVKTCLTCGGAGQIQIQQGFFAVQRPCNACSGTGQRIESTCNNCHGKGVVHKQKTLSVKIPAGVDTGNRIRLSGEGEAGIRGGLSGDLYVQIHVKKHAIFERQDSDLYCEVPIDFATAVLGGQVEVPTLDNKLNIKVPAGTQTGKLFRLRSKGITHLQHGGSGDVICKVKLETPINLSKKQQDLLQKFSNSCGKKHHPESNSFFGKMKSFFE
ncbi:molecular chaperone DnaJ [Candidatus Vesicomyidisocius calyptogenae]|uniref:Chaperone protein DnaJ n=1 Tax=Vesicomyosocius okutanii subsp. Calyptogena okutanii (strain HA) TaxID=412965 RepID=DNAJ_VESOH|nr:molecular chaperone DnaJ [Candidatus Vesicomyosocius okutanii]A5CX57.1 RecName: Full=Chaperone protein DnaJ [Candidatus Vesicomyosocius okutanii]BAF61472.1 chaperone protein DnaJ [Candidatus Vesicomyosocius okutanii]